MLTRCTFIGPAAAWATGPAGGAGRHLSPGFRAAWVRRGMMALGLAAFLAAPGALRAAASISGLVVPAAVVAGQDFTVTFTTGAGCTYVGIALSPFSTFTCPQTNGYPYPWVLHDTVHYAGGFDAAPDFRGMFGGGLNTGCSSQTLSYVLRAPPDASATMYVHVLASSSSMVVWGNNPCSYDVGLNSGAVTVTGRDTTLRVNMMSQRTTGGEGGNVYQQSPSVANWGLWPVDTTRFCMRMYVNEPASPAIVPLSGSHYILALNTGVNWGPGTATPFATSVSYSGMVLSCTAGRQANWTLQTCFTGAARYIPGNGGFLKPGNDGDSAGTYWNGGGSFAKTDDYSQAASVGVGFSGRVNDFHYTLYDGGSLVCEYISYSVQDPNTGQEPCGISNCATPTPTPTPNMPLVKTADRSMATLGDTITYCINWSNAGVAPQPLVIWDSLNAVLQYLGGSPAATQSGQVLSWDLGTVAPGASGQICFGARVSGYP